MLDKVVDSFQAKERAKLESLRTDHQREGFVIIRAFAGAAEYKGNADFATSQSSLADRLSITLPGATSIIGKLIASQVLLQSHPPVRHKQPGR